MIEVDANDLKKLILTVEMMKEILLSRELYRNSDGELTGWAKKETEEASDSSEAIKEDLEFTRRTEEAFRRIEAGEFIKVDSENLFEEMDKW